MNIRLQNLINAIMFDREKEFEIILDQWEIDFSEIVLDYKQKTLIHFLAEHGKLDMMRLLIAKYNSRHANQPPTVRRTSLEKWINALDSKGNTAAFYAAYNGYLVVL